MTLPLQTFGPMTSGQTVDHVVVAYDNDTTGGTDADLQPVTIGECRIDGTAIPTVTGTSVIVDFSSGWAMAT